MTHYEYTTAVYELLNPLGILLDLSLLELISDCWVAGMTIAQCLAYLFEGE